MHLIKRISAAYVIVFCACGTAEVAPALKTRFEVLQDQPINNGSIREVFVRIDEPITENQIKAVAFKVKSTGESFFPKTKVWFLLPAQRIGSGAWASATFRPELEVKILGARAERHQALKKTATPANGQLLGHWIWDAGPLTHKITLIKRGGEVLMLKTFVGPKGDSEVDETVVDVMAPNRYRYPGSKTTWMTVNNKGELEFHDQAGRVDAARPVK
jgi:hypothetical protein